MPGLSTTLASATVLALGAAGTADAVFNTKIEHVVLLMEEVRWDLVLQYCNRFIS